MSDFLDAPISGGQAGADPARVLAAMRLPGHKIRSLLLAPGGAAALMRQAQQRQGSDDSGSDDWAD